jgi:hypothetical protein
MPNTLAHIGINGLITKSIIKKSDILWIYLGCVIPDVPWIVRKIIEFTLPNINGYDLQLYVIVQASLFFSLMLSLILALFSIDVKKTFLILGIGSLLHLLVDSLQTKWANGVHLFAPFSWDMTNYGFFWPESIGTYFITILGLAFFIFYWKNNFISRPLLEFTIKRIFAAVILGLTYFFLPLIFVDNVEQSDNHFISTLRNENSRAGSYVEMDRKKVVLRDKLNSYWIESFDKSLIELTNIEELNSNRISIKGKFISNNEIYVEDYQENWSLFRDGASYVGLFLILASWLIQWKVKIS